MSGRINGPMLDLGTRRVLTKEVVTFPVPRWSDGSGNESAAAVWANVLQDVIDTRGAKRALIGANARLKRVRGQCLVAVLTGGSELKHSASLSVRLTSEFTYLSLAARPVQRRVRLHER
jgi:hypothetical protein